ncbi:MAG: hypothetical protein ACYSWW_20195 [Planctomycetota bacterium]|jgi:hypothetical protein
MKNTFVILILLIIPAISLATPQVPDVLVYDDLTLPLSAGWGYPSPLETYYYQNRIVSPFRSFSRGYSTANYRGHVAVWKIVDAKLYLIEIRIEDYDPNTIKSSESYDPNDFGVESNSAEPTKDGHVLADWFSGILHCYSGMYGGILRSHYFHVRNGKIVETQITDRPFFPTPENSPDVTTSGDNLKRKDHLHLLCDNYTNYYFRLSEHDEIECDEPDCRLDTGYARLSPIFGFYDNSHLNWPYNWENTEKCGAPHCKWLIEDGKLYLAGVELYSGGRLDRIDTETLDLTALFDDKVKDGVVWADWVSGVYLIEHGEEKEENLIPGLTGLKFTVFKITESTYIRIKQGHITESYTVSKDFDSENLPEDTDPDLKQIVEDYKLPTIHSTP